MTVFRTPVLLGLTLALLCCALPQARADLIYEPNNSLSKAYLLTPGQRVVNDSLSGNEGRADTILGHFDPAYSKVQLLDGLPAINDNYPGVGNGFGSKLVGVPLRANGSAYFSISGAPDAAFDGSHAQDGKYRVTYEVFAPGALPGDLPVKTLSETEFVTPAMWDNVWLDPDLSKPDWTGYTVNVTVNNIAGPGTGDALDFFVFRGLAPFEPFTAVISDAEFSAILALYNPATMTNTPIASSVGGPPVLSGIADSQGRVKIGVSGLGDINFLGEHFQAGLYTLSLVPEPSSLVLLGLGTAALAVQALRRRRRRAD